VDYFYYPPADRESDPHYDYEYADDRDYLVDGRSVHSEHARRGYPHYRGPYRPLYRGHTNREQDESFRQIQLELFLMRQMGPRGNY
jgi:hypothetical protein